jgi:Zn-dependent protease with chaperone function
VIWAACLLTYGAAVILGAPSLLTRATRPNLAPGLAIAMWTTAVASAVLSELAAVVLLIVGFVGTGGDLDQFLASCFDALRALTDRGHPEYLAGVAAVLASLAAMVTLLLVWRAFAALRKSRTHGRAHALSAVLAARATAGRSTEFVLIESTRRSVYCVATRPHTIVVTRGALDALNDRQLGAVLAHERAHIAGHHHQLFGVMTTLAKIMPRIRLFTEAAAAVALLVEWRADDAAASRYGRDTVVDALLALTADAPVPSRALGAAATAVADRAERLLFPPRPSSGRILQRLGFAVLLIAPVTSVTLLITQSPWCSSALG